MLGPGQTVAAKSGSSSSRTRFDATETQTSQPHQAQCREIYAAEVLPLSVRSCIYPRVNACKLEHLIVLVHEEHKLVQ